LRRTACEQLYSQSDSPGGDTERRQAASSPWIDMTTISLTIDDRRKREVSTAEEFYLSAKIPNFRARHRNGFIAKIGEDRDCWKNSY